MMWKKLLIASVLILAIIIGVAGCDSFAPPSSSKATTSGGILSQQSSGIWVTGEGCVTVVPDVAILSLGVEAQASTVAEAQQQAAIAMDSVVRELGNHGIAQKDIKTQNFSIQQLTRWDNDKQQQIVIGYQVNNMVTVKVRNIEETGTIIDAVAKAGEDYIRINSISFTVDDPSPYLKDAREDAMADAKAKAKQLADSAGIKLGEPTYINESGGYTSPTPIFRAEAAISAAPSTPISPGETEIKLTVQVVYGIK